ncbi:PrsW family intramembrane metalloprotease [bacterium]|nr:PrsW family intramembrane metalloprotease [bacterium]
MVWILLTAAVAPVVFMLHFVYVRDKYEPEPLGRVMTVFFVSFLTVIPAAIVEAILLQFQPGGLIGIAIAAFLVIALSEEFFKYLAIKWLAVRHPSFNEVYDGILYAVAASLGFAVVENIMYVFFSAAEGSGAGIAVAVARALLSVPGHALWGVMMGYYIGLAKLESDHSKKRPLVIKGVALAVFWHGLYDFFAFGAEAAEQLAIPMAVGVLAVIVVNWIIGVNLIKKAQELSCFKRPHPLVNPIAAVRLDLKYCHRCGFAQARGHQFCNRCGYEFPPPASRRPD